MDLVRKLPTEVSLPILLSFDIASLARLRTVCKAWCDFFSREDFWQRVAAEHGLCDRATRDLSTVLASRRWQRAGVARQSSDIHSFRQLCQEWYIAHAEWDGVQDDQARMLRTSFRGLEKMRLKVAQFLDFKVESRSGLFVIYHHDQTHKHKVYLMDMHTRDVLWVLLRPRLEGRVPVAVMPVRPETDADGNVLHDNVNDSFAVFGLGQAANRKAELLRAFAGEGYVVLCWSSPEETMDCFQVWKIDSGADGQINIQLHAHQLLSGKLKGCASFRFPTLCLATKGRQGHKALFYEIVPSGGVFLQSTLRIDHLRNADHGTYGLEFNNHQLYTYSFEMHAVNAYDRRTNELKWSLGDEMVPGDLGARFRSFAMQRPRKTGMKPRTFYEAELKKDAFPIEWDQWLKQDEDLEWPFHQVMNMKYDETTQALIMMVKPFLVIVPKCKERGSSSSQPLPPIISIRLFDRGQEEQAYLAQWPLAVASGRVLTFGMDDAFLIDLLPDRAKRLNKLESDELEPRLFMAKIPRPNKPYDHDSEEAPPSVAHLDASTMFAVMDRVWDIPRKTRCYPEDGLHSHKWNSKIHRVDRGIVQWTLDEDEESTS